MRVSPFQAVSEAARSSYAQQRADYDRIARSGAPPEPCATLQGATVTINIERIEILGLNVHDVEAATTL
ncbi:hypothetical protein ACC691_37655, partial [Rhizobium johnstonii]|uniref:hypothetical protein n=1 Tax=Rhizobium johnstonii TaxID=3019933 RepID=UPI003F982564